MEKSIYDAPVTKEGYEKAKEQIELWMDIVKEYEQRNNLGSETAKAVGVDALVIKAAPQACAAAEEISKTLTKQQLSFKEKLIISLAGNDKYVLMKEIDRDRVKGIVYKDFDYEETAKTIIKQAEKIIEIMEA